MYVSRDLDGDGDMDLIATRGNSGEYDGVFGSSRFAVKRRPQFFRHARQKVVPSFAPKLAGKYDHEPPISHPTRSAITLVKLRTDDSGLRSRMRGWRVLTLKPFPA